MVRRLLKISVCTAGPNTSNNVIQGDPVELELSIGLLLRLFASFGGKTPVITSPYA